MALLTLTIGQALGLALLSVSPRPCPKQTTHQQH